MSFKDLSHLPAPDQPEGLAPDSDTTYVRVLVDELAKAPRKPQVSETLSRHSSAASCLKRVALLRDGVEPEPMDLAGLHVTNLGTLVHEAWQASLTKAYEGRSIVEFEVPTTIEDLTSGSCDALILDTMHVLELKTTGGFGYKLMVGERGQAQGPKSSHMVQLALNVMGLDADKGTLVYLSNEAISKGVAERKGFDEVQRFGAQWTFPRSVLQPLADEWLEQLRWVRDHPTEQVPRFVPHEMPRGSRLNPETGAWTLTARTTSTDTPQGYQEQVIDSGQVWGGSMCLHYCPVGDACRKLYAEGK